MTSSSSGCAKRRSSPLYDRDALVPALRRTWPVSRETRSRKGRPPPCSRALIRSPRGKEFANPLHWRPPGRSAPRFWRNWRLQVLRGRQAARHCSAVEHIHARRPMFWASRCRLLTGWESVRVREGPHRAHSRNSPRIFVMARSVYYFTDSRESGAEAALLLDREPRPQVAADFALNASGARPGCRRRPGARCGRRGTQPERARARAATRTPRRLRGALWGRLRRFARCSPIAACRRRDLSPARPRRQCRRRCRVGRTRRPLDAASRSHRRSRCH